MREFNERRFKIIPYEREELIKSIVSLQKRLIELENLLGNVDKVADEAYLKTFEERLSKLNDLSLRKYYSLVDGLVRHKEIELNNKLIKEENDLYHQFLEDYLGEIDPSIVEGSDETDILENPNVFPGLPVNPVSPFNPDIPWWSPNNPWRITCKENALVRSL